jgi:hypothetical protein
MPSSVCCRSLASRVAAGWALSSRARQAACSWDRSMVTCAGALLVTPRDQLCSFDRPGGRRPKACRCSSSGLRAPPYQRQIGRTRNQQRHGERDVHSLGGFEGRSHRRKNIGRFWSGSLARYFSPDSGLVYDSGIRAGNGARRPRARLSLACDAPAPAALKPHPVRRVKVVCGRNFNALRAVQQ